MNCISTEVRPAPASAACSLAPHQLQRAGHEKGTQPRDDALVLIGKCVLKAALLAGVSSAVPYWSGATGPAVIVLDLLYGASYRRWQVSAVSAVQCRTGQAPLGQLSSCWTCYTVRHIDAGRCQLCQQCSAVLVRRHWASCHRAGLVIRCVISTLAGVSCVSSAVPYWSGATGPAVIVLDLLYSACC